MKELKSYDRDFARLYNFFVYACNELEANEMVEFSAKIKEKEDG